MRTGIKASISTQPPCSGVPLEKSVCERRGNVFLTLGSGAHFSEAIYGSRDVFAQFDLGQKLIGPADTSFLEKQARSSRDEWVGFVCG